MLNTVYQLRKPGQLEVVYTNIELDGEHVLVAPTHLSICHADQRYYQGTRSKDILMKKLPMALIHEGIGEVVYDPTNTFSVGDAVVMIPNVPVESDEVIGENYLRSSLFRGSTMDGFLQEYIKSKPDRLVKLPENINKTVAAMTEIVSVSYHAIKRFEQIAHERRVSVGIWGDGNLGYITALLLKKMYPHISLHIFGMNDFKLQDFSFADNVHLISEIPDSLRVDHAFECVGGSNSGKAINQIIDYINPEGTISLLGVSEELVPLNTRMVLEKGLRLFGSSRSGAADYEGVIDLYTKYPEIIKYFSILVSDEILVRSVLDITKAFETDYKKPGGKTVMLWQQRG